MSITSLESEMTNIVAEICSGRSCGSCPLNGYCSEAMNAKEENNITRIVRDIYKQQSLVVTEDDLLTLFK